MSLIITKMLRFILDNAYGAGALSSVTELTEKIMQMYSDVMSGSGSQAYALYTTFVAMGIALLVVYTIINTYETIQQSDGWSVEGLVRTFVGFLIGYGFIKNSWLIMGGMANLGHMFVQKLIESPAMQTSAFSDAETDVICAVTTLYLGATRPTNVIRAFIFMAIPTVIVWVSHLVINLIIIERFIELIARVVLAPLALAGSFSRGIFAHGVQYIKKIATLSLQGVVAIVLVWAGTSIQGSLATNKESILGGTAVALENATAYVQDHSAAEIVTGEVAYTVVKPFIWVTETVLPMLVGKENADAVFDFASGGLRASKTFSYKNEEEEEEEGESGTAGRKKKKEPAMSEEDAEILTGIQRIGKQALYGTDDTGGILDFSSMIFLCAMQVAILMSVVKSQSLAADIIG